ncbi:MAG TPA: sigma-70 family RNA polymerase sigma factor [Candidatus Saccharimonadales bacterium]|jgi:RNA polymerase sigma factor (sigma-70 family)|nr:sigma-70 family RNA polymerase sigma factor [Candidatus Saccharimonadales bacterium]
MPIETLRQTRDSAFNEEDRDGITITLISDSDREISEPLDNVVPITINVEVYEHSISVVPDIEIKNQDEGQVSFLDAARAAAAAKRNKAAGWNNIVSRPANLESEAQFTPQQQQMLLERWNLVEYIARKIVKNWRVNPEELEEAVGDGYLGLVEAVQNYNTERESETATTGSSFFAGYIRGYIFKGMRARYGRDENDQIARLKPSVMNGTASALDEPIKAGEAEKTIGDFIASPVVDEEAIVLSIDVKRDLEEHLRTKGSRDREIFWRYFIMGQTQQEIADIVGTSKRTVSRIVKNTKKTYSFKRI